MVWGSTQQAMTQEAAITDCCACRTACALLNSAFEAYAKQGSGGGPTTGHARLSLGELRILLTAAFEPFLSPGFRSDVNTSPEWSAQQAQAPAEPVTADLTMHLLRDLPGKLSSDNLWNVYDLHQRTCCAALDSCGRAQISHEWARLIAAAPFRPEPREHTGIDPIHLLSGTMAALMSAKLDASLDKEIARLAMDLTRLFRALDGPRLWSHPLDWTTGASSMHLARRFGLLVDPFEFRETYSSLLANSWDWSRSADITVLAHDPDGAALAFAKRMGNGFVSVVPAAFSDEAVLALTRVAADHWALSGFGIRADAERPDERPDRRAHAVSGIPTVSAGRLSAAEASTNNEHGESDRTQSGVPYQPAAQTGQQAHLGRISLDQLVVELTVDALVLRRASDKAEIGSVPWVDAGLAQPDGGLTAEGRLLVHMAGLTRDGRSVTPKSLAYRVEPDAGTDGRLPGTKNTVSQQMSRLRPTLRKLIEPYVAGDLSKVLPLRKYTTGFRLTMPALLRVDTEGCISAQSSDDARLPDS